MVLLHSIHSDNCGFFFVWEHDQVFYEVEQFKKDDEELREMVKQLAEQKRVMEEKFGKIEKQEEEEDGGETMYTGKSRVDLSAPPSILLAM